jgi:hypothetical protein
VSAEPGALPSFLRSRSQVIAFPTAAQPSLCGRRCPRTRMAANFRPTSREWLLSPHRGPFPPKAEKQRDTPRSRKGTARPTGRAMVGKNLNSVWRTQCVADAVSAPRPRPASSKPHMPKPCPPCQRFGQYAHVDDGLQAGAGDHRRRGNRDDYQSRFNRFKIVQLPGNPDDMPGATTNVVNACMSGCFLFAHVACALEERDEDSWHLRFRAHSRLTLTLNPKP